MDIEQDETFGLSEAELEAASKMRVSAEDYAKAKRPVVGAARLAKEQARILRGLAKSIGVSDKAKAEIERLAATAEAGGEVVR